MDLVTNLCILKIILGLGEGMWAKGLQSLENNRGEELAKLSPTTSPYELIMKLNKSLISLIHISYNWIKII